MLKKASEASKVYWPARVIKLTINTVVSRVGLYSVMMAEIVFIWCQK
jgi:hypothetical protein